MAEQHPFLRAPVRDLYLRCFQAENAARARLEHGEQPAQEAPDGVTAAVTALLSLCGEFRTPVCAPRLKIQ